MIEFRNRTYTGSNGRKSLWDADIRANDNAVVIFIHGYKGFKDWGPWNLVRERFLSSGFGFVKFNISHNGGTVENPVDFPDLEAFGKNRYSWELNDTEIVIRETIRLIGQEAGLSVPLYLMGHSRGGGIAILAASRNPAVRKVISLAGICDIGSRFPEGEELESWKTDGVMYVANNRTNDQMPHEFAMYEDYLEHRELLDIEKAVKKLSIPFLQIHGDVDTSVGISEGLKLAGWSGTHLKIIKGADHTFGTYHPFTEKELAQDMCDAIDSAISFFNS